MKFEIAAWEDLSSNCSIFLLQFLAITFKINQQCTKTERIWVFDEDGGKTLPQNDPAQQPPPEITKLGGACGSTWELRGWWQPGIPQRTLPLEGVLDTLAPQGYILGLSSPRIGRDRLAGG